MAAGDPPDDPLGSTWAAGSTGLDTVPATPGGPSDGAVQLGPGARVGRHVLEALLGAGGMGVVYRARDPQLDRVVAVKLVRSRAGGDSGRARLLREAQAMAKLHHVNVVPIFDVGTAGDDVYVVMPLLEGGTLGSWVRAAPRAWHAVLDRFVAAGRGLVAAHAAGLVHRDFKPDNVLLGGDGEIQVADFGIARFEHDAPRSGEGPAAELASLELTRTGDLLGTPAYMAPEQLRGEASDARADQFSFCVALWEGLFDERPFSPGDARGPAALAALLASIEAGKPATPTGREVPAWLREILARGLRMRAEERWPSMAALLAAIAGHRRGPRRPLVIGVIAAAVVLAGAALAWNQWGRSPALTRADQPQAGPGEPSRPATTRSYRRERLTRRGDITAGKLSPDGTTLALVGLGVIIVRDLDPAAGDRARFDIADSNPIAMSWSPRRDRIAVSFGWGQGRRPDGNIDLIETQTGAVQHLALHGAALAFLSDTHLAVSNPEEKRFRVHELPSLAVVAECAVPGDYIYLSTLDATADGATVLVGTLDSSRELALHVFGRDCAPRGTLSVPGGIGTYALSNSGRSVWLIDARTTTNEAVERSFDGAELSRARLGDDEELMLLGEVDGRHYHIAMTSQMLVERLTPAGPEVALSSDGDLSVAVAPDGKEVAWIERPLLGSGPLRITSLDRIAERGPSIMAGAVEAAWSPDGKRLAVATDDAQGPALFIVDRATGTSRRIARGDLGPRRRPVWLDDHRVAAETTDNQTIAWIDADSGATGELVDRAWGRVFNLARSPRDGTVAFAGDRRGESLRVWTLGPGGVPVATDDDSGAVPVWSPDGELWSSHPMTGALEPVEARRGRKGQVIKLLPDQLVSEVHLFPDGRHLVTLARTIGDVSVSVPE